MGNAPKQKGTAFENEVAAALSMVWPDCHRAEANNESMDLRGTGDWVIECKHRKRWQLFDWIRRIRRRTATEPGSNWAIVAAHGDRRTTEGSQVGVVAVVDFESFVHLLIEAGEGSEWK